jgi:protein-S-isoprenylcysteine O-methyltransferase Ste14
MKKKGPLPPLYLLASIVAMVALHLLLPGMKLLSFPWSLLGVVPFVIGVILNLVADRAFKKYQTTVKPFEESSALVTDGVFRMTRHPMYLGFLLILLGLGLFMGSLIPFVAIPIFAVLMDLVFIRTEEKMLEEKFGQLWLRYRSEVRRWM